MTLILLFVWTISAFSATIQGMRPDFKHRIQTFYEGDFRAVMELYNKYTEDEDYGLVNPCKRYSEMEVLLDPLEFTSIAGRVITSLNTAMALTLDGRSNFPIYAVMECEVRKNKQKVFEFFVLLLPSEWAASYTDTKLDFIPVYKYAFTDAKWQLFAVKDAYDFQMLRSTFTGDPRDHLRIPEASQYPQLIPMITKTLIESLNETVQIMNWKHLFGNFILLLDERNRVRIPAISVFKVRIQEQLFRYTYMIIFDENPSVYYPPYPFRYPIISKQGIFRYVIYNTEETIDGMWAFSLDFSIVNPVSNIYRIPPFVNKLDL